MLVQSVSLKLILSIHGVILKGMDFEFINIKISSTNLTLFIKLVKEIEYCVPVLEL